MIYRKTIKDSPNYNIIEPPMWISEFQDLNGSGAQWDNEMESEDNEVLIFYVEREEDNRHIKGGSFSRFGKVVGMPLEYYKEFYGKPEDNGFKRV